MRYFSSDFETITEVPTRVWATCITDILTNEVEYIGNDLDVYMDVLKQLSKRDEITMYFHNLKFDGHFILSWLLRNGWSYNEQINTKNSYSTLITDTGAFYCIKLSFYSGKKKKITIYDSNKIIPLPVKKIPKAFGLTTLKGDIDYKAYRPIGHKLTAEEKKYIIHDCTIVGQALKTMFDRNLDKMTLGSNAMAHYKETIGKERFAFTFPTLDKATDDYIRKSYKGGYVYVNPKYKGKILNTVGQTYDVNSLYPSVMYYRLLPWGEPIYFEGEYPRNPQYPLYIQKIRCKFKVKKGYLPTIQLKGHVRFGDTEYIKDSGVDSVELYLTNVDLKIFFEHYNVYKLEYIDGYMFRGAHNLFKRYIDYWTQIKIDADKQGNEGQRQIAKLMLNNLYGKFAQNPKGATKQPYLDDEGVVKLELVEGEDRKPMYTAMASFITAYAREVCQTAFQQNYERCCYCDTDSIHLVGEEVPNIDMDDFRLGAWKHEGTWDKAKFLRPKTYMEHFIIDKKGKATDELLVKAAGIPDKCKDQITFENLKSGLIIKGVLYPKVVKGGVVLVEGVKEIM